MNGRRAPLPRPCRVPDRGRGTRQGSRARAPARSGRTTSGGPLRSDLTAAHIRDASAVATLDAITTKYEQRGKSVEITGLDERSADLHGSLGGRLTGSG